VLGIGSRSRETAWRKFAWASPEDPNPQNPIACGSPKELNLVDKIWFVHFSLGVVCSDVIGGEQVTHLYLNEWEKNGV
jgi:hypothetical protein